MHFIFTLALVTATILFQGCSSQSRTEQPDFYYKSGLEYQNLGIKYHSVYHRDPSACVQWRLAQRQFVRSDYSQAFDRFHEVNALLELAACLD